MLSKHWPVYQQMLQQEGIDMESPVTASRLVDMADKMRCKTFSERALQCIRRPKRTFSQAMNDADFSFLSDYAPPSEVQLRSLCWDSTGARAYHPGPNGGETDHCRDSSLTLERCLEGIGLLRRYQGYCWSEVRLLEHPPKLDPQVDARR